MLHDEVGNCISTVYDIKLFLLHLIVLLAKAHVPCCSTAAVEVFVPKQNSPRSFPTYGTDTVKLNCSEILKKLSLFEEKL